LFAGLSRRLGLRHPIVKTKQSQTQPQLEASYFRLVAEANIKFSLLILEMAPRTALMSGWFNMKKALCGLVLVIPALCWADGDAQRYELSISGRSFPGYEVSEYYGLSLSYRGESGFGYVLRGGSAPVAHRQVGGNTVGTGGSDLEFMVYDVCDKYPAFRAGLGIAAPNTPSRNNFLEGTYDLSWTAHPSSLSDFSLGAKGIYGGSTVDVAYAKAAIHESGITYFADAGVPIGGENTINPSTGNAASRWVADLGARIALGPAAWLQVAYSNTLGETTGLSITPTFGGSFGIAAAVGFKF